MNFVWFVYVRVRQALLIVECRRVVMREIVFLRKLSRWKKGIVVVRTVIFWRSRSDVNECVELRREMMLGR